MKTHIYNSTLLHILYTIFQIFKPIFRKILAILVAGGAEKMEGGNEENEANGITQFAEGEEIMECDGLPSAARRRSQSVSLFDPLIPTRRSQEPYRVADEVRNRKASYRSQSRDVFDYARNSSLHKKTGARGRAPSVNVFGYERSFSLHLGQGGAYGRRNPRNSILLAAFSPVQQTGRAENQQRPRRRFRNALAHAEVVKSTEVIPAVRAGRQQTN